MAENQPAWRSGTNKAQAEAIIEEAKNLIRGKQREVFVSRPETDRPVLFKTASIREINGLWVNGSQK